MCVCVLHYELFSSLVLTSFDFPPQNVFGTFHKYKQPCYASTGALFIKQRFYMFDVEDQLQLKVAPFIWRQHLSLGKSYNCNWFSQAVRLDLLIKVQTESTWINGKM